MRRARREVAGQTGRPRESSSPEWPPGSDQRAERGGRSGESVGSAIRCADRRQPSSRNSPSVSSTSVHGIRQRVRAAFWLHGRKSLSVKGYDSETVAPSIHVPGRGDARGGERR